MFAEPQTVTINAVAKSLPRVSFGDRKGVFEDVAGNRLTISHTFGRRNRDTVRLDVTKTAPNPLLDGVSAQYSMSAFIVIDKPAVGFDAAEQQQIAKALADYCANAGNLTKVVGGES